MVAQPLTHYSVIKESKVYFLYEGGERERGANPIHHKKQKLNFILMKFYLLIVKETNEIELKYIITVRLRTTFIRHLIYF